MTSRKRVVLIADDDPGIVRILTMRCAELGLDVESAHDGLTALMNISRNPPDMAILDVDMPGADGLSICDKLASDEATANMPIVILSGQPDPAIAEHCRQSGIPLVVKGVDAWDRLRHVLHYALQLNAPEANEGAVSPAAPASDAPTSTDSGDAPRVLLIEDDADFSRALQIKLRSYGLEVFRAFNATFGIQMAWEKKPDLIITDYTMPDGYGNYVLMHLKDDRSSQDIPVFVVTGRTVGDKVDYALKRDMERLGASHYFTKPIDFEELLATMRRYIRIPSEPVHHAAAQPV